MTEQQSFLQGKRVLVTRPAHQATDFILALRDLGADPISFPTIEIRPVADTRPLDSAIQRLEAWAGKRTLTSQEVPPYDWLVLTSANGVEAFWAALRRAGLDSRCLASLRIAAI